VTSRARRALWIAVAAVAAAGIIAASASADTRPIPPAVNAAPLGATLDSARAVPAPAVAAPAAFGLFWASLVEREATGTWSLSWQVYASGLTGPVTAVQIRVGKAGETGPLLLTLCRSCVSTPACESCRAEPFGGVIGHLTAVQVHALRGAAVYVNVQTAANPSGEIRGQLARPVRGAAPTAPPSRPQP
jgi:CHRD domain